MSDPFQETRRPESPRSGLAVAAAGRRRGGGFTLIELMVVIGLLGIFIALALPSFNNTMRRFRVNAASTEITNALQFARAQAIATRQQVNVGQAANPDAGCSSADLADWHCGIDVYVDVSATGVRAATEPTIKTISASDFKAVGVQINAGVVSYSPLGFSTLTGGFAPAYVWLLSDGADPATAAAVPGGYVNTVCIGAGGGVKVLASYATACT